MKLFSYHVYDKWTGEASHGVVAVANKEKAKEKIKEWYSDQYNIDDIEVYDLCISVYGKEERMSEVYQSYPEY